MKKLLRLDSIAAGGRARQEVHDLLASRCVVVPHSDLPQDQAEELASQVHTDTLVPIKKHEHVLLWLRLRLTCCWLTWLAC